MIAYSEKAFFCDFMRSLFRLENIYPILFYFECVLYYNQLTPKYIAFFFPIQQFQSALFLRVQTIEFAKEDLLNS